MTSARAARALDLLAGPSARIGVAVSGGPDSMALLVLAAQWARARGRGLVAATVDHGLRPEAAEEALRVKAFCENIDVAHTTLTWTPDTARAQADVRFARHRLLAEWARETGVGALAVGHTQDDRIETFLIRARAGSGWWGLAAPMPSSANPAPGGPRIVRPLLAFERASLQALLRDGGIGWIDDPSNAALRYERVRMRALAAKLAPHTQARLVASLNRLCEMRGAAMKAAHAACQAAQTDGHDVVVNLSGLGDVAGLRLLEAMVISCGGEHPPPLAPLESVCAGLASGEGFRPVNVGGAWLRPAGSGLKVGAEPSRRGAAPGAGPDLDRAAALLADPVLAALFV